MLEQRLDMHLVARVHESKRRHWKVHFVPGNLAKMAAAMIEGATQKSTFFLCGLICYETPPTR